MSEPQAPPRLLGWICARCGQVDATKPELRQVGQECSCGGLMLPVRAGTHWLNYVMRDAPTFEEAIRRPESLWLAALEEMAAAYITSEIRGLASGTPIGVLAGDLAAVDSEASR